MAKSLFNQFAQIRGSRTYDDSLSMLLAELSGRAKTSGLTVDVTGGNTVTITAGGTFEKRDVGNFVVIGGSAYKITGYTSTSVVTVSGSPTNTTDANAALHYFQNLEDDLNYIRTQLELIVGENNWYDAPDATLSGIRNELDNLSSSYLGLTDTYIGGQVSGGTYTADNMLYTSSSGVHDTSDMTYDPDTGDIRMGADGGARMIVDADVNSTLYGDDDTYLTVSGSGGNIAGVDNSVMVFNFTDSEQIVGPAGDTNLTLNQNANTITFESSDTAEMVINTSGMTLKSGASVNDIVTSIVEPGDDTQLATEQAIVEYVTTVTGNLTTIHNSLTGLQGGTTDEYYHLTNNEYTAFSSDGTTFTFSQALAGTSLSLTSDIGAVNADFSGTLAVDGATTLGSTLDVTGNVDFYSNVNVSGTFGFDGGTAVNNIVITMSGPGSDDNLVTEQGIVEYLSGSSGALVWEKVSSPFDRIQPRSEYMGLPVYTSGDMTIGGDLTVTGTLFYADVETVRVADNIMELNYGEPGNGVTAGEAGISIDRGGFPDYQFLFDETTDTFRVGVSGIQDSFNTTSLQPVATREDAPIDTRVPWWEDASNTFRTQGDTYITVNSGTDTITVYAGGQELLDLTTLNQILGNQTAEYIEIDQTNNDIDFNVANTTEMTISTGGMSLKSGVDVNEILASTDSLDASSTDDQLATAKLIYNEISTLSGSVGALTYLDLTDTPSSYTNNSWARSTASGVLWDTIDHNDDLSTLQGGTTNEYYHITSNENSQFSAADSTHFSFVAGTALDVAGTFELASGTSVNDILSVIGGDEITSTSTDDQLVTAKLIYDTFGAVAISGTPYQMYYVGTDGNMNTTDVMTFTPSTGINLGAGDKNYLYIDQSTSDSPVRITTSAAVNVFSVDSDDQILGTATTTDIAINQTAKTITGETNNGNDVFKLAQYTQRIGPSGDFARLELSNSAQPYNAHLYGSNANYLVIDGVGGGGGTLKYFDNNKNVLQAEENSVRVGEQPAAGKTSLLVNMSSDEVWAIINNTNELEVSTNGMALKDGVSVNDIVTSITADDDTHLVTEGAVYDAITSATGTMNHNDLNGLQGGTTNEYYHLTSNENSAFSSDGTDFTFSQNLIANGTFKLATGTTVNEIITSIDVYGPGSDDQLATEKAIFDFVSTVSGVLQADIDANDEFIELSDTPAAYTSAANQLVRVNSTPDAVIFESELTYDGSTLLVGGDINSTGNVMVSGTLDVDGAVDFDSTLDVAGATTLQNNLTVNGTFGFDTGTTVNEIVDTISGSSANQLVTENGIVNYLTGSNGALVWEVVDTPYDRIQPRQEYMGLPTYTPGDFTVGGDMTVTGTLFYTNTETVQISDNTLVINYGEVGAGVTAGEAGIIVDRGTQADYYFIFDETQDNFRVGISGSTQAVATREDSPTDTRVPWWNDTDVRFDTAGTTFMTINPSSPRMTASVNGNEWLDVSTTITDIFAPGSATQANNSYLRLQAGTATIYAGTGSATSTAQLTVDDGGIALASGPDVNEILDSTDELTAASTDDQLATAKLLYDEISTLSGSVGSLTYLDLTDTPSSYAGAGYIAVINGTNDAMTFAATLDHNTDLSGFDGGGGGEYNHLSANEYAAFSSDGTTWTFSQNMALASGTSVNDIDIAISSPGDDNSLATTKAIVDYVDTISGSIVHNELEGLQGGTTNEYYHLTSNEDDAFSSDGTTFTFTQSLVGTDLTLSNDINAVNADFSGNVGVSGTFGFDVGTSVNDIQTSMDPTGDNNTLLTEAAIYNWVNTVSGVLNSSIEGKDTFLELTDTINSYTANDMLYTTATGVADTADMTYDPTTGDIRMGADGGAKVIVDASESTKIYGNNNTYITVSGGNTEFTDDGTLRMSVTDLGLALQTGERVDTIDASISAPGLDTSLVTEKAVVDYITTATGTQTHNNLNGLQGGTAGEYYHLTSNENSAFSSDGTTFTFSQNLAATGTFDVSGAVDFANTLNVDSNADFGGNVGVSGTFGFDTGTTVNEIVTSIDVHGPGSDDQLATEKAIFDFVSTVSGVLDAEISAKDEFIELTDTPAAYAGNANYLLRVNGTPDSVIFESELSYDGSTFIVSGDQTVTGSVDVQTNLTVTGTLDVDGATDLDGTLNVAGATTLQNNLTVNGTFGFDTGTTVNEIATTMSEPGDDDTLITEQGIVEYVSTISGAIDDSMIWEIVDTPYNQIRPKSANINKPVYLGNNLTIAGDLTVSGTTTTINSQELTVADKTITVNYGEAGNGVTGDPYAGLIVDRGTETDYWFVFEETSDTFRVGISGSLQAVATREDAPIDTAVAFWNDTTKRFDTSANMTFDSTAGLSLGSGASVNEILASTDSLDASSTDDQLATAKLIYDEISTLSGSVGALTFLDLTDTPSSYSNGWFLKSTATGLEWDQYLNHNSDLDGQQGGTTNEYYHLTSNEYNQFSAADSTHFSFVAGTALDVAGTFELASGTSVNEIVTTVTSGSTDNQLPTAGAVWDAIDSVNPHTHYDKDMTWGSSGSTWTLTDASLNGATPDGLEVYVNGLKNRNNSDYYTVAVVGTTMTVTFAYTTYDSDWVNVTYLTIDA